MNFFVIYLVYLLYMILLKSEIPKLNFKLEYSVICNSGRKINCGVYVKR